MELQDQNNKKWFQKSIIIIAALILFFPIGLYLMWRYAGWNKIIKLGISGFFLLVLIAGFSGKSPEKSLRTDIQNNKSEQQESIKIETAGNNETLPTPTRIQITQSTLAIATIKPTKKTGSEEYPGFTEETMNKDFIFSCAGGDMVGLWEKPAEGSFENRVRERVPCGISGWAFNKYDNKELNVSFYAVQTNDKSVKNAYGWVTEDLLTWR